MIGSAHRARRDGWRLGAVSGSAIVALLLASEVASLMAGAGALYFASVVAAWLVLPAVVGLRSVLDAGCFFMLVSLGIVVDAARNGPISLLAQRRSGGKHFGYRCSYRVRTAGTRRCPSMPVIPLIERESTGSRRRPGGAVRLARPVRLYPVLV